MHQHADCNVHEEGSCQARECKREEASEEAGKEGCSVEEARQASGEGVVEEAKVEAAKQVSG